MTIRAFSTLSAIGLALASQPLLAGQSIPYETGQYEYAQPDAEFDDDVVTESLDDRTLAEEGAARVIPMRRNAQPPVYVRAPVVQPVGAAPAVSYSQPATSTTPDTTRARANQRPIVYGYPAGPAPVPLLYAYPAPAPAPAAAEGTAQPAYGYGYDASYAGGPAYLPAGSQVVAFDRSRWLEECRDRLDTYTDESERGRVIGALVGAAAGGLAGNRIAGSGDRTAGTLIGAGAGALAGMAAGDALDRRQPMADDSYGQCEAYLDKYMQRATASAGTAHYTRAGQYMLVPVTVQVPQRPVYRDGSPAD